MNNQISPNIKQENGILAPLISNSTLMSSLVPISNTTTLYSSSKAETHLSADSYSQALSEQKKLSSSLDIEKIITDRFYADLSSLGDEPSGSAVSTLTGSLFKRREHLLNETKLVDILISCKVTSLSGSESNISSEGLEFKGVPSLCSTEAYKSVLLNGKDRSLLLEISPNSPLLKEEISVVKLLRYTHSFCPHIPYLCSSGSMNLYDKGLEKQTAFDPLFKKEVAFWRSPFSAPFIGLNKPSVSDCEQLSIALHCLKVKYDFHYNKPLESSCVTFWTVPEDASSVYCVQGRLFPVLTKGKIPILYNLKKCSIKGLDCFIPKELHNGGSHATSFSDKLLFYVAQQIKNIPNLSHQSILYLSTRSFVELFIHSLPLPLKDSGSGKLYLEPFYSEFHKIEEVCGNVEIKMYMFKRLCIYIREELMKEKLNLINIINQMNNEFLQTLPYVELSSNIDFYTLVNSFLSICSSLSTIYYRYYNDDIGVKLIREQSDHRSRGNVKPETVGFVEEKAISKNSSTLNDKRLETVNQEITKDFEANEPVRTKCNKQGTPSIIYFWDFDRERALELTANGSLSSLVLSKAGYKIETLLKTNSPLDDLFKQVNEVVDLCL